MPRPTHSIVSALPRAGLLASPLACSLACSLAWSGLAAAQTTPPAKPATPTQPAKAQPAKGKPKARQHRAQGGAKDVHTELEIIDLENPDAPFEVRIAADGGKLGYVEGERFTISIDADVDCYVTVLAVDPAGEVSVIVPGIAAKPDDGTKAIQVKKGSTLTLPAGGAKFRAQPPHGESRFKVIATLEPLTVEESKPGEKYRKLLEGLKGIGVDDDGNGPDPLRGSKWSTAELWITTGSDAADLAKRQAAEEDGESTDLNDPLLPVPAEPKAPTPRPNRANPKAPLAPRDEPDANEAYRTKWEEVVKGAQGSKAIGTRFVRPRSVFERRTTIAPAGELLVVREAPAGSKAIGGGRYRTEKVPLLLPGSKAIGDEALRERVAAIKAGDPTVRAVVPNGTWQVLGGEQDFKKNPFSGLQWHLYNTELSGGDIGWMYRAVDLIECTPVPIGIVDQGVHINEPRLQPFLWKNPKEIDGNGVDDDGNGLVDDYHGWNFASNSPALSTSDSAENHGTYCTSIMVGGAPSQPGNFFGVTYNATVIPAACMAYDESKHTATGSIGTTLEAIAYAADQGAKVINLSLGGPTTDLDLLLLNGHPLWDELEKKGVLLVIAAGNENTDIDAHPVSPACLPRDNTIVVMAVDPAGRPGRAFDGSSWTQYSNWGRNTVHIAAPGTMVLGIPSVDLTSYGDGTSYAAPIVTGVAAILWSKHPDWDYKTVKRAILETARQVDGLDDKCITGGMVDLNAALEWKP